MNKRPVWKMNTQCTWKMNTRSTKRSYDEPNVCIKCGTLNSVFYDIEGLCSKCTTVGKTCYKCLSINSTFYDEAGACLTCTTSSDIPQWYYKEEDVVKTCYRCGRKIGELTDYPCKRCEILMNLEGGMETYKTHLIEVKRTKDKLIERFAAISEKTRWVVGVLTHKKVEKEIFGETLNLKLNADYYTIRDLNIYRKELQTECKLEDAREKSIRKLNVNSIQYLIIYGIKYTLK